ncbi:MAG TPA: hypothetical protein VE842_09280 [Pyrinomonadaceae bacterium]|nr:hypothetical protein [Pyrinomonadaceae bacterium]
MLIDDFLPVYDVTERHQVLIVSGSVDEVYAAVRRLDISSARITPWLFRLRGMQTPPALTLDQLLKRRFILLGEKVNEELLLGVVGKFWTLCGDLRRLDVEGYRGFSEEGYAKAAWNFSLAQRSADRVLLRTETRVRCTDARSRRRFRLYWSLIGPFSGLIRIEMLREIKRQVESKRARAA